MFLKCSSRLKDGKEHRYWSIVENKRVVGGRVVQGHVLYLGEINSSQQARWRRTIDLVGGWPAAATHGGYCLHVTLRQRLAAQAPGLTPRAVIEKFKTVQMIDVHLPTSDGRLLILPRYT